MEDNMETALVMVLVIFLGACVVALLILGICTFKDGIQDREGSSILIGLVCMAIVIMPCSYLVHDEYQKSNCVIKSDMVDCYVTSKEYTAPYTTFVMSGKVMIPINYPENYNVNFKYKDVKITIDDKELYNQIKKGGEIQMKLKTYIQPNGKIYKKELIQPK